MGKLRIVEKQRVILDTDARSLRTPTDLKPEDTKKIAAALNGIVADGLLLYVKTKNFHWHMAGPHFRGYHVMLDEQGEQILASIDPLAERVRKIGQNTLRSIAHIARTASLEDNDEAFVSPLDMLSELAEDNKKVAAAMRKAHALCDDLHDVATASLLEVYIDEAEKRTWFLFESSRGADESGH